MERQFKQELNIKKSQLITKNIRHLADSAKYEGISTK